MAGSCVLPGVVSSAEHYSSCSRPGKPVEVSSLCVRPVGVQVVWVWGFFTDFLYLLRVI